MARARTAIRGRSAKRSMEWIAINDPLTSVAGSAATLLFSLNAAALLRRPFTIVRTRITLHFESDQSAASETPGAAFGMGVASEPAVAAGIASLPTPLTEPNFPWFVYEGMFSSFLFGDATGFVEPSGRDLVIDSKAMRKVANDEDMFGAVETISAEGAIVGAIGRFLVKLH